MKKKPFRLGLLVGRFQVLHSGHEDMINKAVAVCDRVGVFVGSSEEHGNFSNPFTYEKRAELLKTVFGDKIEVYPLPDIFVGNNSKWGDYVLQNVYDRFGEYPDLFVSGRESRRVDWFDSELGLNVAELCIPKTVDISAHEMRDFLVDGRYDEWKKYTSPLLWDRYEELRSVVLAVKDNHESRNV